MSKSREARRLELIEQGMPLVEKIAQRVMSRFVDRRGPNGYQTPPDMDDFRQQGYLGLLEAADRYVARKAKAGKFKAFAFFRIRGSIIDANRRRAYRDQTNLSFDHLTELYGGDNPLSNCTMNWNRGPRLAAALIDRSPLPDLTAERDQTRRRANRAIAELPAIEREIITRAIAGERLDQICLTFQRSPAWAREKLAIARAKVARKVAGEPEELEEAA